MCLTVLCTIYLFISEIYRPHMSFTIDTNAFYTTYLMRVSIGLNGATAARLCSAYLSIISSHKTTRR